MIIVIFFGPKDEVLFLRLRMTEALPSPWCRRRAAAVPRSWRSTPKAWWTVQRPRRRAPRALCGRPTCPTRRRLWTSPRRTCGHRWPREHRCGRRSWRTAGGRAWYLAGGLLASSSGRSDQANARLGFPSGSEEVRSAVRKRLQAVNMI